MAKSHYIPKNDGGKLLWRSNLSSKMPTYANTLGVTNAVWKYRAMYRQGDEIWVAHVFTTLRSPQAADTEIEGRVYHVGCR